MESYRSTTKTCKDLALQIAKRGLIGPDEKPMKGEPYDREVRAMAESSLFVKQTTVIVLTVSDIWFFS